MCDSCQLGDGGSQRTGSAVLLTAPGRSAGSASLHTAPLPPSWIIELGSASLHSALGPPSWITVPGAEIAHGPQSWGVSAAFHTRESHLKGQVWGFCMRRPVSKWNKTQHKGRDKRWHFISLFRFYFYSQGILDGLCQWLFHHSPASLGY